MNRTKMIGSYAFFVLSIVAVAGLFAQNYTPSSTGIESISGFATVTFPSGKGGQDIQIDGITPTESFPVLRDSDGNINQEWGTIYTVEGNHYFVDFARDASTSEYTALPVTIENGYYKWTETDNREYQALRRDDGAAGVVEVKGGPDNEFNPIPIDPSIDYERRVQEINNKRRAQSTARSFTFQALNMLLGPFAQEAVTQYCREQFDSSDYGTADNTPINHNAQLPFNPGVGDRAGYCRDSLTSVTAQGERQGDNYILQWTVLSCKEVVSYTVYLQAPGINQEIATGSVQFEEGETESAQQTLSQEFTDICIIVTDTTIGENGNTCFPLFIS